MANGFIDDIPPGISQAQFDVLANPLLRQQAQQQGGPSGLQRFAQGLVGFGAGVQNPLGAFQQIQQQQRQGQQTKLAAIQLALERLPEGDIRRDELAAQFDQLVGVPGAGAAISAQQSPPEQVKLGARQRLFERSGPGQPFQELVPALPGAAGRPTETQTGIAELQRRGFSRQEAEDIQRGRVKVSPPDAFGDIFLTNAATGETTVARRGAAAPEPVQAGAGPPLPGLDPLGAVERGIGPKSNVKQLVSDFVGPFVSGAVFSETTEARQRLGLFNKTLERGLVNNPRFPVAEAERVVRLLPDPETFFKDPDAARSRLIETRDFMKSLIRIKESEIKAPGVTSDRKAKLADETSILRENLALFGPLPSDGLGELTVEDIIITDPKTMTPEQIDRAIEKLQQVP